LRIAMIHCSPLYWELRFLRVRFTDSSKLGNSFGSKLR
jgi:hypothetical protein